MPTDFGQTLPELGGLGVRRLGAAWRARFGRIFATPAAHWGGFQFWGICFRRSRSRRVGVFSGGTKLRLSAVRPSGHVRGGCRSQPASHPHRPARAQQGRPMPVAKQVRSATGLAKVLGCRAIGPGAPSRCGTATQRPIGPKTSVRDPHAPAHEPETAAARWAIEKLQLRLLRCQYCVPPCGTPGVTPPIELYHDEVV